MARVVFILLLTLFTGLKGYSGEELRLTIADGLSQGMVTDILQDSRGFMWFATLDGLNRYDGSEIRVFQFEPDQPHTLSDYSIISLKEDSRGFIWVGTASGGLNVFDPSTERFFHIKVKDGPEIQSSHVSHVNEAPDGNIWVGSHLGLDIIEIPDGFKQGELLENEIIESLSIIPVIFGEDVYSSLFSNGSFYIGTEKGLWRGEDINQPENIHFDESVNEGIAYNQDGVFNITLDEFGHLWLIRPQSITSVTPSGQTHHNFDLPTRAGAIGFEKSQDGNFRIGGYNVGLYRPGEDGSLTKIRELTGASEKYYFSNIFTDRSDLTWFSTSGYGLLKYNPTRRLFGHRLEGHSLRFIESDDRGRLFITHNVEQFVLDKTTLEKLDPEEFSAELLRSHNVLFDSDGNYWFHLATGRHSTQLAMVNPRESSEISYFHFPRRTDKYTEIFKDLAGKIWMNSDDGYLMRLDPETGEIDTYNLINILDAETEAMLINSLVQTRDSVFWLGTSLGLLSFDLDNGCEITGYRHYTNRPGEPESLGANFIFNIAQDPHNDQILWLGTRGGGLNKWFIKEERAEQITIRDGLPNNVVYGVLPRENDLWMSTNRGLSRYIPSTGEFSNFSAEEGLQDFEFNHNSLHQTPGGLLAFGGVNGVNVFHPDKIPLNEVKPRIEITEVRVNNQRLNAQTMAGNLSLRHDENQVAFKFSALDFNAPAKNLYRYRMEGLNPEWLKSVHGQEVSYVNLAPGKYTFSVKGTNNSGLWSERSAVFSFEIKPPWWSANAARVSYALLFILGVYGFIRFQSNRAVMKQKIAYEQREKERLLELDKFKSDFFTNLTHEIKTPLTLIVEPVRRLKKNLDEPGLIDYAKRAEKNCMHLMDMVQQLLDLSKLESGKLELQPGKCNIAELVANTVEDFYPLAFEKDLAITTEIPSERVWILFDHDKFSHVIDNLLSNAVKFCPPGGEINVALDAETNERGDWQNITLRVRDTGPGVPEEYRERIFERFFQLEEIAGGTGGTGIGLSYTKQIINLMGGTIECGSAPDKGAEFTVKVRFPMVSGEVVADEEQITVSPVVKPQTEKSMDNGVNEDSDKRLLLLVEDNARLMNYMRQELSEQYNVICARDGKEGLDMATSQLPDIIISDVMMPNINGIELCKLLKDQQLTSHIPILLLTAKSDREVRLSGYKTGADDYLTKPFELEELLVRTQNLLLNRHRLIEKVTNNPELFEADSANKIPDANSSRDTEFLKRFDSLIEEHLDNSDMTTEDLAKLMFLSRTQLHRKIKAITGRNTSEYIRNYRLFRARDMLQNGAGNVGEVAIKVGIPNRNYFTKKFRELHQCTPSSLLSNDH